MEDDLAVLSGVRVVFGEFWVNRLLRKKHMIEDVGVCPGGVDCCCES